MIVFSDGDIIKNRYDAEKDIIYPVGYDSYTRTLYANKELLLNAVNYLVGDEGLMDSRSRSITLRKLDENKCRERRSFYQVINIIAPLLLLGAAAAVIVIIRKKKYCK
jgi:ABC-2 type transport system permease protein